MNLVTIYTDGSCHGNPGPGGYAAIVQQNDKVIELCGGDFYTTNNRMELTAVIEGLRTLTIPSSVTILSDSKYVVKHINDREDLCAYVNTHGRKNVDLWQTILQASVIHQLSAQWIRGHSGNRYNHRCDFLANGEASRMEREKNQRLAVFGQLIMNDALSAEIIAGKTKVPVRTVREYQSQYFKHKRVVTEANEQ